MSPLTKAKAVEPKKSYTQYILPTYVAISALFILFVAYSYFQGVVYNSGALRGQQVGYEAAYIEVINAVSQGCETISLNLGDTTVEVINVACLQQATNTPTQVQEVVGEESQ